MKNSLRIASALAPGINVAACAHSPVVSPQIEAPRDATTKALRGLGVAQVGLLPDGSYVSCASDGNYAFAKKLADRNARFHLADSRGELSCDYTE